MSALTMKMPLPIMDPATSITPSNSRRDRLNSVMGWIKSGKLIRCVVTKPLLVHTRQRR
jgi:hypothetical protein